jgi:hypothetical protein
MEAETIQKNAASPKSHKNRKNFIAFAMLAFALSAYVFTGCDKEDAEDLANTILQQQYLSVQNGTVHKGAIPSAASGVSIADNITINRNAITGGSSFVSIASEQKISEIYVSVEGVEYYYSVSPTTAQSSSASQGVSRAASSTGNYSLVILFSQNLNRSFTIQVSARLDDGSLTSVYSAEIRHIAAGTGSLQVSLSFDNEKDIDLYLVQPDGEVIYYGNRGSYDEEDGQITGYGLDIDSNADCYIDGVNNENIFYSSENIQSGKYEVWVNMYNNCDLSIPTNWVITALREGTLITTSYGQNPAYGVFPVNTPSNSIGSSLSGATKVLEFTLSGQASSSSSAAVRSQASAPLTESAKAKLSKVNK